MGAGKTTAKSDYITELIVETPRLRTLDVACNRLFSLSNAASLELVAAALRAKGPAYKDVTAVRTARSKRGGRLGLGEATELLPPVTAGPRWSGLLCALRTGAAAAQTSQWQRVGPLSPCAKVAPVCTARGTPVLSTRSR